MLSRLRAFGKPTIAAVEGYAIGVGWSLALACDLLVASRTTFFAAPASAAGMIADGGLVRDLCDAVGHRRAAELLLTRSRVEARDALRYGLVTELTEPGRSKDRAVELAQRAVTNATEMRAPFSMAYALYHTGFLHFLRQEPEAMRERGVGVLDVATEYELPIWRAVGTVLLGAARADLGHADEGLAEISDGIDQYQGLHSPPVFWPLLLYVRARACGRAGRSAEGLEFIEQALAIGGEEGALATLFIEMKGQLLGPAGADWYRRGFVAAAAIGARSPQLRAAVGLYRAQRTDEHEELVRSTYATFTEGFETPDLLAARELLDQVR